MFSAKKSTIHFFIMYKWASIKFFTMLMQGYLGQYKRVKGWYPSTYYMSIEINSVQILINIIMSLWWGAIPLVVWFSSLEKIQYDQKLNTILVIFYSLIVTNSKVACLKTCSFVCSSPQLKKKIVCTHQP